jgi:threonine dehydratase
VIAASAGNHAQGVAFAARHLKIPAVIVMPQTTPEIKVDAVRDLGAEVVLFGDTYADAQIRCHELAVERRMVFVHPFDDPLVIAGQGTVGDEILRHRLGDVSAIFVPVGGGGLIAGIGSYVKALRPTVKVIGVEPFGADAMFQSLAAGRRVVLESVDIFADGGRGERSRRRDRFRSCSLRSTRWSGCRTTRFAPRSKTSSTTRERLWNRPGRLPSPDFARGPSVSASPMRGSPPS